MSAARSMMRVAPWEATCAEPSPDDKVTPGA
jgi:hypothetical protein